MTDIHACLQRAWPIAALPLADELQDALQTAGIRALRPAVAEALGRFLAGGSPTLVTPDPAALLPLVFVAAAQRAGIVPVSIPIGMLTRATAVAGDGARTPVLLPGDPAPVGAAAAVVLEGGAAVEGLPTWTILATGAESPDALYDGPAQPAAWRVDVPPGVHRLRALRSLLDAVGDDGWICVAGDLNEVALFLQRQGVAASPGHPAHGGGRASWDRGESDTLVVSAEMRPEGAPANARVVFTPPPTLAVLDAWRATVGPDAPFVLLVEGADGEPPVPAVPLTLPDPAHALRTARQLLRLRAEVSGPLPEAWLGAAVALSSTDEGVVILAHALSALDRALRAEDPLFGALTPRPADDARRRRRRKRRKGQRADERADDAEDDVTEETSIPHRR